MLCRKSTLSLSELLVFLVCLALHLCITGHIERLHHKNKAEAPGTQSGLDPITMAAIAMTTKTQVSKPRLIISWIMSGIVILFMLIDSLGKFFKPTEVIDGTLELGFQIHHLNVMGILGLLCIVLYSISRTSLLGMVLLTGYYGGVIATHLRLDNPLFTHILFPVYLAVLAWGGLWLRNGKVRELFPLQSGQ